MGTFGGWAEACSSWKKAGRAGGVDLTDPGLPGFWPEGWPMIQTHRPGQTHTTSPPNSRASKAWRSGLANSATEPAATQQADSPKKISPTSLTESLAGPSNPEDSAEFDRLSCDSSPEGCGTWIPGACSPGGCARWLGPLGSSMTLGASWDWTKGIASADQSTEKSFCPPRFLLLFR